MTNEDGVVVRNFKNLAYLGVKHFGNICKEPTWVNIAYIIKLASYFPQMVREEDNNDIYEVVSKDELLSILSTFKKETSHGLDG